VKVRPVPAEDEDEDGSAEEEAAVSRHAAKERMQRLLNSKKRDINKKGVITEGDVGLGKAATDAMLLSDDEDDIVDDDDDDDDDDEDGEGEEQLNTEGTSNEDAGLGMPPKSAGKVYDQQRVVPKGDADMRLDRWLKVQFPFLPNSKFQKLIRKRKVWLLIHVASLLC
jgi:hypothetical protein